jgi:hypothetical protein
VLASGHPNPLQHLVLPRFVFYVDVFIVYYDLNVLNEFKLWDFRIFPLLLLKVFLLIYLCWSALQLVSLMPFSIIVTEAIVENYS